MKIELREFKFSRFLVLTPENETERKQLDLIGYNVNFNSRKIDATIQTDDCFNPYIRVRI